MGRHRLDQEPDGRPDHGADEQWADDLAAMRTRCEMELCPHWSGDGNVCPCAVFGLNDQGKHLRSTTFATSTEAPERGAPC